MRKLDPMEWWDLVLKILFVLVYALLAFSFYQAFLLLVDIVNAPVGEAHLVERGLR